MLNYRAYMNAWHINVITVITSFLIIIRHELGNMIAAPFHSNSTLQLMQLCSKFKLWRRRKVIIYCSFVAEVYAYNLLH